MARCFWTALLVFLIAVSSPVAAQRPGEEELRRKKLEAQAETERQLAEVDGQLRRGEWERAQAVMRARLDTLFKETDQPLTFYSPGPSPVEALARLAVAEAGLGREADALWHWQAAQALGSAPLGPEQLRLFGAPGAFLDRHPRRRPDEAPAGMTVRRAGDGGPPFVPPRHLEGEIATPAAGSEPIGYPEWLRVQVVVGADGNVSRPVLLQSTSWRLAYRVLEGLRSWRFEPARVDGAPVAAFHEVQVNPPADSPPLDQLYRPAGEIAEVAALLRAGEWAKADKKGDRLWRRAFDANLQTREFYGLLLTLRALAEVGVGRADEAICRWHAAQALARPLFHADLSAYGAPGELLERNRWALSQLSEVVQTVKSNVQGKAQVQRPEIRRRVDPLYPEFRRSERAAGTVILETVIDERGVVRNTRILRSDSGLDFDVAAIDAVCAWRFEPARFENKPVKVYYSLTINFAVR